MLRQSDKWQRVLNLLNYARIRDIDSDINGAKITRGMGDINKTSHWDLTIIFNYNEVTYEELTHIVPINSL